MSGRVGRHFTDEELIEIRRAHHDGIPPAVMAERLGCARRTITAHYGRLRGLTGYTRSTGFHKPRAEPRSRVMPDRFYHSNFEPG